jgi:hypothetical protein
VKFLEENHLAFSELSESAGVPLLDEFVPALLEQLDLLIHSHALCGLEGGQLSLEGDPLLPQLEQFGMEFFFFRGRAGLGKGPLQVLPGLPELVDAGLEPLQVGLGQFPVDGVQLLLQVVATAHLPLHGRRVVLLLVARHVPDPPPLKKVTENVPLDFRDRLVLFEDQFPEPGELSLLAGQLLL